MRRATLTVLMAMLAASGAGQAATPLPAGDDNKLDEVLVQADRRQLSIMRIEIVRLEEKFYSNYNALNTDRQFDIHCFFEAATGTLIKQRICRARFVDDATHAEALGFFTGEAAAPASLIILEKNVALKDNMQALIVKNPELRKALVRYNQAQERYAKVRAEKMKGHFVVGQ
jgi:hypothetical protein